MVGSMVRRKAKAERMWSKTGKRGLSDCEKQKKPKIGSKKAGSRQKEADDRHDTKCY